MATGFSPFFLTHGREAILPVQRHLDEPRLDPTSKFWLHRLWRARVDTHEAHMRAELRRRKLLNENNSRIPVGTIVAISLSPRDKANYPAKFTPRYAGPWVITESYSNGIKFKARDLVTNEERQVTRNQFKLLDLPEEKDLAGLALPRIQAGAPVEPSNRNDGHISGERGALPQVSAPVTTDYGLRPVASRRAREAERRQEEQRRVCERAETARFQQGVDDVPARNLCSSARNVF
ncbi:hypothetical protein CSUI_005494, partial [Cystoisospora suis]